MKSPRRAMIKRLRQTALKELTPEQRSVLQKCDLRPRVEDAGRKQYIYGKIDGHEIKLTQGRRAVGGVVPFSGTIDGGAISAQEAQRLWSKYCPIAHFQVRDFEEEARERMSAQEAEAIAKAL